MKKNIVYLMLASLLLFTGCANYLDQDPEDLNSMDKIFSSKIETTKWYNRIYSDDFMVQEMHYSGQIPYFWCTDESAYILESHVRNIAEGKMTPTTTTAIRLQPLFLRALLPGHPPLQPVP